MVSLKQRGGICGIMGDRYFNINNSNRSIWYIDANNLNGYAMMQKILYKDFEYTTSMAEHEQRSISLYTILNTPDDSDHGYYIVCDINYTNSV